MQTTPSPIDYETPPFKARQKANKPALASLVAGIVSAFIPLIPSIAAILLGYLGIRKARDQAFDGRSLAILGAVLGAMTLMSDVVLPVLLPSRAPPIAVQHRYACAGNMRMIGQAILRYRNDHNGLNPSRLEELLLGGYVTSSIFICPESSDKPSQGATTQAQAAILSAGGHESYIYLPNALRPPGNSSVGADIVILYEPLADHGDGMNVLFGDLHVDFIPNPSASKITAEPQAGFDPPRKGHY